MSDRLTSDWTEGLEEVFGELGRLGELGELLALKLLMSKDIKCKYNPADEIKQNGGLDIEILIDGVWHGIDVKANIHNDGDTNVCVEYPKLKKSKSTYWLHINIEDPMNDYIIYPVKNMIEVGRAYTAKGEKGLRWVPKDVARNLK